MGGPFLGPLNTRCLIILRTQEGTIILANLHEMSSQAQEATAAGFSQARLMYRFRPKREAQGQVASWSTRLVFH